MAVVQDNENTESWKEQQRTFVHNSQPNIAQS